MKKASFSISNRRNKIRSINSFKRKLKEKAKRKARRKNKLYVNNEDYIPSSLFKNSFLNQEDIKLVEVEPPPNFSFLDNTENVLIFIGKLKKAMESKVRVLVDLRGVTNLTNDAIALLLASVRNPNTRRKCFEVRGNYPVNPELRKIIEESAIFKENVSKTNNYILTRREKKADGKIAEEVISRVTKVLCGVECRCPGIYRALMESMANTCYHAKPSMKAYETWWLSIHHNRKTDSVSFAFIDIGVGVFRSRKIRILAEKLKASIGLVDESELLKNIFEGKVKSSTKLSYRGKGLPAIFKGVKRNYYSNLRMITNNVLAEPEHGIYKKLKNEFNGTFLYWEFNKTNLWIKS